jgi:hypothetical protein
MGCDIHLYVERQNKKTGAWEFVSPPQNGTRFVDGRLLEGEVDYRFNWTDESGLSDRTWFSDRNYTLFGYLAGVRSCPTDTPFSTSFGQGKLPPGLSEVLRYIVGHEWASDAHSHFWGTLAMLTNYFTVLDAQLKGREVGGDPDAKEDRYRLQSFYDFLNELSELCDDPRRIRVVAFFDN